MLRSSIFHLYQSCTLLSLCAELFTNRLSTQEIVHQTVLFKINNKKKVEKFVYETDRIIRSFTCRANWFWVWAAKCFLRPAMLRAEVLAFKLLNICLKLRISTALRVGKYQINWRSVAKGACRWSRNKGNGFFGGCTLHHFLRWNDIHSIDELSDSHFSPFIFKCIEVFLNTNKNHP